jgi:hypothetical protein
VEFEIRDSRLLDLDGVDLCPLTLLLFDGMLMDAECEWWMVGWLRRLGFDDIGGFVLFELEVGVERRWSSSNISTCEIDFGRPPTLASSRRNLAATTSSAYFFFRSCSSRFVRSSCARANRSNRRSSSFSFLIEIAIPSGTSSSPVISRGAVVCDVGVEGAGVVEVEDEEDV